MPTEKSYFRSEGYSLERIPPSNSRRAVGALQTVFAKFLDQRGSPHTEALGSLCHHAIGVIQRLFDVADLEITEMLL